MGDYEAGPLGPVESPLKYHPYFSDILTSASDRGQGQCLVGSLTGAVASQTVTEAPKGSLSVVGNHAWSAMAQGSLTARPTSRADAKAGHSDPVVLHGKAIA